MILKFAVSGARILVSRILASLLLQKAISERCWHARQAPKPAAANRPSALCHSPNNHYNSFL